MGSWFFYFFICLTSFGVFWWVCVGYRDLRWLVSFLFGRCYSLFFGSRVRGFFGGGEFCGEGVVIVLCSRVFSVLVGWGFAIFGVGGEFDFVGFVFFMVFIFVGFIFVEILVILRVFFGVWSS